MADESPDLAKDLGLLAALTIGIGTMVGAGIFVLPGPAVARAGPATVLGFVLAGAIALLTALSVAELGTAMPKAGGAFHYINQALGPFFGSIAGWGNWLGLAFASAFYMVGFAEYIGTVLPVSGLAVAGVSLSGVQVVAVVGSLLFVGINYIGARETGLVQVAIVLLLVAILVVFAVVGLARSSPVAVLGVLGDAPRMDAVLPVTGFIFVSYLGFVQITSVGEEIRDPGRNLPIAVIGSVVFVTLVYTVALVTLLVSADIGVIADNTTAVIDVARLLMGPAGAVLLLVGGLLATASSANASILASSRINFAMGRDGIISPRLNEIHARYRTPYRSIGVTGLLIVGFVLLADVETLAAAGSVLHLIVYGLVNLAVIVMRTAPVEYAPTFRVPGYPVVPAVGAVSSLALIGYFGAPILALAAGVTGFAVVWYLVYARTRSRSTGALAGVLAAGALPLSAGVRRRFRTGAVAAPYRVVVPIRNPETARALVRVGATVAAAEDGVVLPVRIHQVPDQTPLESARAQHDPTLDEQLFATAEAAAAAVDVPVEAHTFFSHKGFEAVYDAARQYDAALTVIGRGPDAHGSSGRAGSTLRELRGAVPSDFLTVLPRGLDVTRIVLPTAGGADTALAARVARALADAQDVEVLCLHVRDDAAAGMAFLQRWADEHGLGDATLRVDSGDPAAVVRSYLGPQTLLLMGATSEGVLPRLVGEGSLVDAIAPAEASLIIAERRRRRSWRERLLGR